MRHEESTQDNRYCYVACRLVCKSASFAFASLSSMLLVMATVVIVHVGFVVCTPRTDCSMLLNCCQQSTPFQG